MFFKLSNIDIDQLGYVLNHQVKIKLNSHFCEIISLSSRRRVVVFDLCTLLVFLTEESVCVLWAFMQTESENNIVLVLFCKPFHLYFLHLDQLSVEAWNNRYPPCHNQTTFTSLPQSLTQIWEKRKKVDGLLSLPCPQQRWTNDVLNV